MSKVLNNLRRAMGGDDEPPGKSSGKSPGGSGSQRVFISYARQDRAIAQLLAERLQVGGLEVWLDIQDISAGVEWYGEIQKALDGSDLLLLLVSPESMSSRAVANEWQYFLEKGKPIIPIVVRPTPFEQIPFRLQMFNMLLLDQEDFDTAFEKLTQTFDYLNIRISPEEARLQQRKLEEAVQQVEIVAPPPPQEPSDASRLLAEARSHQKKNAIKKAVEGYSQLLLDRSASEVRVQAVNSLGELRAASGDLVQSLFDDPSSDVRRAIVRALANFQSPAIDEALQTASIADDDLSVRLYAALVELYFKQPNRVKSWLDMLATNSNERLRAAVSEVQLFANELVKLTGHVFISYSRQDAEDFTLQLVDTLRSQHKFQVWVDTNLTPGTESWKKAIAKAIEQCSLLMLVLSPSVHDSKWIGEEVSYAEQLGKDRLFVKYKETHMPFGMAEMQGLRADLTFADYPEEMLAALIDEFQRRSVPRSEVA